MLAASPSAYCALPEAVIPPIVRGRYNGVYRRMTSISLVGLAATLEGNVCMPAGVINLIKSHDRCTGLRIQWERVYHYTMAIGSLCSYIVYPSIHPARRLSDK